MLNRRALLAAAAIFAAPTPLMAQSRSKTLRIVPPQNLTILDPITTTAEITVTHGYMIFDTLYGVNSKFEPKPQMAEACEESADGLTWRIKLRGGLKFHDGQPVRAADCAASLDRWSKRDAFGQTLARYTEAFEATDDSTVQIRLKRAFPRLLDVISKPHSMPAFVMPERLARTDPMTPVSEMIGSGPFRFVAAEYVSGAKVVYSKFEDYVPRTEPADWTSGRKEIFFDRVEWIVMNDLSTASAALQNGEVDWWIQPLPDLIPVVAGSRNVRTAQTDPYGYVTCMRFNCIQPPFNNELVRKAVYAAINQEDYMQAIGFGADAYQVCLNAFPCGIPGVDAMPGEKPGGISAARDLLRKSGYKGEKVVILSPSDSALIAPLGPITADLLTKIGMNVELQETDWGTVTQRRTSKEPTDKGGWSIFHTNWPSVAIANPALNTTIRGQGAAGWFGWYDDPEMENLVSEWLFAPDEAQQRIFNAVQKRAMDKLPVIPIGQFRATTALRREITGNLPGNVPYFWGVKRS